MTEKHAESYHRLRVRVTDFVSTAEPAALVRVAPATPEWRVRDVTAPGEDLAGAGDPVVTVGAPRFELVRAVTGRRTVAEIEDYDWDGAPDAQMLLAAPFFTIREESLGRVTAT